jgi:hypothetical protein
MSLSDSFQTPSPIPVVTCPTCGAHMRLSTVEPERDHKEKMTFECACGFDFTQSAPPAGERGL